MPAKKCSQRSSSSVIEPPTAVGRGARSGEQDTAALPRGKAGTCRDRRGFDTVNPWQGMTPMTQLKEQKTRAAGGQTRHALPALPYDFGALEPHIDTQTMQIHHGKHHQAYVNNLNAALEKHPDLFAQTLEQLLRDIDIVPDDIRTVVRNNAGGHHNHSLFWTIMAPPGKGGGGAPSGAIGEAIAKAFGGFPKFKESFTS